MSSREVKYLVLPPAESIFFGAWEEDEDWIGEETHYLLYQAGSFGDEVSGNI